VRARVTGGDERADLWRRMNQQYAGFDDYEARTSRDIAVFALDPKCPTGAFLSSNTGLPRRPTDEPGCP